MGGDWLLLTPEGRRAIAIAWYVAAAASLVTYWVVRSPAYALGLAAPLLLAPLWARWCLRRG